MGKLILVAHKFYKIKPEVFFIFSAIFFYLLYVIVTPPFQAPDELNHFYRAYRIADGSFLPEKVNNRLGGEIPKSFEEFIVPFRNASTNFEYKVNTETIFNSFSIELSKETEFQDFPNTSYYSPISYLPQAIAIFYLKKINCSIATIYYCGKLFVFIVWIFCMFYVIKNAPIYKWLFTLLILLPMNLYITNSYSADTVTSILAFAFISFILQLTFKKAMVRKKDILFIITLLILLAFAKVVYVGLAILILLIPQQKFNTSIKKNVFIIFTFATSLLAAFIWSKVIMNYYLPYSDYNPAYREISSLTKEANYYAQKHYILTHGFYFLNVISNSIFNHPKTYLLSYIGCFGTYLDIPISNQICLLTYVIIFLIAIFEPNAFHFYAWQKLTIFCAAFVCLVLLLLSQHLTWDAVGKGVVDLLQGRYLIPIFPLIFILFNKTISKFNFKISMVVILSIIFINCYSLQVIYNRFIRETFYEKVEFYCNSETKTKENKFVTTNTNILLDNGICQTPLHHRSGNYAAKLSPQNPYCFTYKFKNLNFGDLVEIEVWQKGEGGQIVVSGNGNNCKEFYYSSSKTLFKDKNGWTKMQLLFTMPLKCNSFVVTFFIWNPTNNIVFFDDIKFSLKKIAQ